MKSPRHLPAYPDVRSSKCLAHSFKDRLSGFSLIELLVVVAIIGILSVFAVPAFQNMVSSQSVEAAGAQISAAIESARTEAMARQTPVWLGFATRTNAGKLELLVTAAASKSGTADMQATNLVPLGRGTKLSGVALTEFSSLRTETRSLVDPARTALASNLVTPSAGTGFTVAGVPYSRTITFTPRGEALLAAQPSPTNGFDPVIAAGLRQARGTEVPSNAQEIALILDGSIAQPEVYRVQ